MNCPVCKYPLIILELEQIEVDYCTSCDGIWLDAGELELLLETNEERNRLINLFKQAESHKEKSYDCPICRKQMKKFEIGEKGKVIVDKCKKNHGIWFDKGELRKVVEYGAENKQNKIINLLTEMFESKFSSKNNGGNK